MIPPRQVAILSDGKPGHVNQSIAFADLAGEGYVVAEVKFRNRVCKSLAYLFDRIGLYTTALFRMSGDVQGCTTIVSAGSETYYANRTLATKLGMRSVAVMLPRGYRYSGFDLIIAQEHDRPPVRTNIQILPINLCKVRPQAVFKPEAGSSYLGLVLGGPNKVLRMEPEKLCKQIEQIIKLFPEHQVVVSTSRRTPPEIEAMLLKFDFFKTWLYSDDPANPIPDFLASCDYVFITADSTSMISEAVSFGTSAIEILPLIATGPAVKFSALIKGLERRGCLHRFEGTVEACRTKIDLLAELKKGLQ
ncbi:MAG: mitochondrial fission ELM1 family protein [Desulfuromonadaceae bacterium]|nr:mitochondrial fission ELM1 family protein [Desulfuromonadaceae bacterium]